MIAYVFGHDALLLTISVTHKIIVRISYNASPWPCWWAKPSWDPMGDDSNLRMASKWTSKFVRHLYLYMDDIRIGYRKLVLARSGTTKCFGFLVGYKAMLATSSQFIHVSCFLAAKQDDSMDIEKRWFSSHLYPLYHVLFFRFFWI